MFKRCVPREEGPARCSEGCARRRRLLTRRRPHTPPPPRRFSPAEDITGSVAMKSSAVRAVKKNLTDLYPSLEPYIDDIIPKKENVMEAKG
jgi:hypothetical protein